MLKFHLMKPGILSIPTNNGLAKMFTRLLPLLTIVAFVNLPVFAESTPSAFRISVGEPGVYRVPYEALIAAGLFVLLRDDRLHWPMRFYRASEILQGP